MTALWISLAAVAGALLVWRLRRANQVLKRILREERDRPEPEPEPDAAAEHPAEHRKG
jgi:hypothetical protein